MKQEFFSLITGDNHHGPIAYNPSASAKGFLLALVLIVAMVTMAPPVGAQEFTDNIIIASHHETLQGAIDAAGEQGMLIVDQDYHNLEPIVLPRRLRMVGMGSRGRAVLEFETILAESAISIAPPAGADFAAWVVIENLSIHGPLPLANGPVPIPLPDISSHGIALHQANWVFLRNLSIHGFGVGVSGDQSSSVHVENCSVSESVTDNYRLTGQSDSWRITGGRSSFAANAGVNIIAASNTLIDGVRFENNREVAILTNGIGTHITHNWFECPPGSPSCDPTTTAVRLLANAEQTSLIDNVYGEIFRVFSDGSNARSTFRFENGSVVIDGEGRLRLGPTGGQQNNARLNINIDESETGLRIRRGGNTGLLFDEDGYLGIGTGTPDATLHVRDRDSTNPAILIEGASGSEGDLAWPEDEIFEMGVWDDNSNRFTRRMAIRTNGRVHIYNELAFDDELGDKVSLLGDRIGQNDMYGFGVRRPQTLYYKSRGSHSWFVNSNATGTPEMHLNNIGLVIGTTTPDTGLQITGGVDAEPGSGGYLTLGDLDEQNIVLDNNEIMARNDGNVSTLHLQAEGGTLRIGGNVGIGTSNPDHELVVQGDDPAFQIRDDTNNDSPNAARLELLERGDGNFDDGAFLWWNGETDKLLIGTKEDGDNKSVLVIDRATSSVGIGTRNPGKFRLAVNGPIRAKEIVVETGWSDFVFEPDYDLRSLEEVAAYIKEHRHLPDIPTAEEVAANGVGLGEIASKLLQKVEELTLYTLQINKDLQALKEENRRLRASVAVADNNLGGRNNEHN